MTGAAYQTFDVAARTIEGEYRAEELLEILNTDTLTGDELYREITALAQCTSAVNDAFLRGLLRTIQKHLERRA